MTVVSLAVPTADRRSLAFNRPSAHILGLVILLAATAFTIWARLALGIMWSGAPAVKQEHELRTEERLMLAQFPDDYPRYRQQVPSWYLACA